MSNKWDKFGKNTAYTFTKSFKNKKFDDNKNANINIEIDKDKLKAKINKIAFKANSFSENDNDINFNIDLDFDNSDNINKKDYANKNRYSEDFNTYHWDSEMFEAKMKRFRKKMEHFGEKMENFNTKQKDFDTDIFTVGDDISNFVNSTLDEIFKEDFPDYRTDSHMRKNCKIFCESLNYGWFDEKNRINELFNSCFGSFKL